MKPTVSIVIPTYNRAETVQRAIESVLRQTWRDFELLIVDDCSTDSTIGEVQRIDDTRIRIVSTEKNMGPSGARNVGICESNGKWIAFQDSDDEWLPEKLDLQMKRLQDIGANHVAAYCGMIAVGHPNAEELRSTRSSRTRTLYLPHASKPKVEGHILKALLTASLVSTQTLVCRRDVLSTIGGFDEGLPALVDWECMLRLAQHGTFAFVDSPLVIQYLTNNSVTRERWRRVKARHQIVEKHYDLMKDEKGVLGQHYQSIAGDERRLGFYADARKSIGKALKKMPFNLKLWLIWLSLFGKVNRKSEELTPVPTPRKI